MKKPFKTCNLPKANQQIYGICLKKGGNENAQIQNCINKNKSYSKFCDVSTNNILHYVTYKNN